MVSIRIQGHITLLTELGREIQRWLQQSVQGCAAGPSMIGKDDPVFIRRGRHSNAADLVRGAVLVSPIDLRKHVPRRCADILLL